MCIHKKPDSAIPDQRVAFGSVDINAVSSAMLAEAGLTDETWCFYVQSISLLDRVGRKSLLLIWVDGQVNSLAIFGAVFQF